MVYEGKSMENPIKMGELGVTPILGTPQMDHQYSSQYGRSRLSGPKFYVGGYEFEPISLLLIMMVLNLQCVLFIKMTITYSNIFDTVNYGSLTINVKVNPIASNQQSIAHTSP